MTKPARGCAHIRVEHKSPIPVVHVHVPVPEQQRRARARRAIGGGPHASNFNPNSSCPVKSTTETDTIHTGAVCLETVQCVCVVLPSFALWCAASNRN